MSRRRSGRRLLVPGADQEMSAFKASVMEQKGYSVDPERPDAVKYEVAKELGIPLTPGDNGRLKTEDAGKIGGEIGGSMVKEMVRMAQEQLAKQRQ